jgi:hypothetical protein
MPRRQLCVVLADGDISRTRAFHQLEETVNWLMREVEPCRQATGVHAEHQQVRVIARGR